jgi:hypothetical protein
VARRRPLLSRDLPLDALDRRAAYVHEACAAARAGSLLGGEDAPSLLMAGAEAAAAHPELVAAADRVIFIDPPLSGATFAALVAATTSPADVHLLWGEPEIGFAGRVAVAQYDLDRCLRSLWAVVRRNEWAVGPGVEEVLCSGSFLAAPPTVAAALRVLQELGLSAGAAGKNPDGKVDLAASRTYTLWQHRYHKKTFLDLCRATTL